MVQSPGNFSAEKSGSIGVCDVQLTWLDR